jgi:hypothetical protein
MSDSLIASLAADLKDSEQNIRRLTYRMSVLEDALELIAVGKRPDGTYNRCREACELVAKEALHKAYVRVSFDDDGNMVLGMSQEEKPDAGALGILARYNEMADKFPLRQTAPSTSTSRLAKIADQYEDMVARSEINWVTPNKESLNALTIEYLENIIEPAGITYKIANIRLGGTYLFKLNHPSYLINENVCYFHHDPVEGKHMWAGQGFHDALDNSRVLALLAEQCGLILSADFLVQMMDDKQRELRGRGNNE